MNQQEPFLWKEDVPGGCHWSGIVRRGTTLRLTDVDGGANAAVLFYNREEKLERYNMADTLKSQHTFYLTKGHACHSDMGRIFCCITADTAGWNDTVCGLSDAALIQQKYGIARYQEHRNQMHRSGLDGPRRRIYRMPPCRAQRRTRRPHRQTARGCGRAESTPPPSSSRSGRSPPSMHRVAWRRIGASWRVRLTP